MKATEFVAALEALIAEHGDLEVRAWVYGSGQNAPASVDLWEYEHCPKGFYVDTTDD